MKTLPVDSLLPELIAQLKSSNAVIVEAPPGSGKTTRIAPSLIDAGLCDSKRRTLLLQPRRVAAKATAERIAAERHWQLGKEVGYQVRFDRKVSQSTALIVATEGILLRRLATDPTIEDIGTVVLDEFHERSLDADLILGMLRRIQQLVRDDLKLIVMSATLDAVPLESFLNAPVLKTTGLIYPVVIKYHPPKPRQKLTEHIAEAIIRTAETSDGDILVFLPGVGEISQTENLLKRQSALRDCTVMPLHGSLPLEQQSQVLFKGERRRIILSTNVAETSLTIEGISTVIDSGQARVLRFKPSIGLDRLQLEPISQSSATQRAGRAGRLQSGACLRLWDEKSHRSRPLHLEPEVRRVDLAAAVLQLYQWGERPADFPWFEAPREDSVATAVRLLEQLGAIQNDQITELGKRMARLPVSPRLARMLIEAQTLRSNVDCESIALVAAMLSERDPFLRERSTTNRSGPPTYRSARWNCDVTQRLLALQRFYETGTTQTQFGEIHRGAAATLRKVASQFTEFMKANHDSVASSPISDTSIDTIVPQALLVAFPDRLARRRNPADNKGRLVGGRGVRIGPGSGVLDAELFLCIDVDDRETEAVVRQACGIDPTWLSEELTEAREEQFFNPSRQQVEARRRRYWNDLVLSEQTAPISDEQQCREILFTEACKQLSSVMPDDKSNFQDWITRLECLRTWAPELDLPRDEQLLTEILRELCPNKRSFAELKTGPWLDWLKSRLTPTQLQAVQRECPESIEVPSGSRIKLDYSTGKPVLAVRIQEIFSWTKTPRIGFGRIPILLHLLAPNFRPQQVTDDLASFWTNTYQVVRKELRRRYPKHSWPEDPLTAQPECKGGPRSS
ncbi:MAG: ATP-dependent helicase HrpB [Pirellulaceae bacterium]